MRKIALTLLIAAATAAAGPLTIQTQETVWSNGLDTITLPAAVIDGSGSLPFIYSTTTPASRFVTFSATQNALIGDDEAPFDLGYSGTFQVLPGGQVAFSISAEPVLAPYTGDGSPDPLGRFVRITPAGLFARVSNTLTVEGTVPVRVAVETPEPSTLALMAVGVGLIGIRIRGRAAQ